MTFGMHLCSACNRRTANEPDDDDDDDDDDDYAHAYESTETHLILIKVDGVSPSSEMKS